MATDHVVELHEARELLCEDSEDCIIGNNEENEEDDDIDSEVDDGNDLMISDGGNASTTSDANVATEYLPLERRRVLCGLTVDSLLGRESLFKRINASERRCFANFASNHIVVQR